jgi:hypothetical protein
MLRLQNIYLAGRHSYSAFGSFYNEMTQTNSAIIVAIKSSIKYTKMCMSMHLATSAIRLLVSLALGPVPGEARSRCPVRRSQIGCPRSACGSHMACADRVPW